MDREITELTQIDALWKPLIFDRAVTAEGAALDELIQSNRVWQTHDTMLQQLTDLGKIRNLQARSIPEEHLPSAIDKLTQGVPLQEYGRWVYYPWSGRLVHLLPPAEFQELRLNANQHKITKVEQQRLAQYTIGIVGLSVGNAVALTLALEGIGGFLKLADFDHLDLSNMNRLRASVHEIGLPKTVLAARQLYEINPYAQLSLFHQGVTAENLEEFLLGEPALDIVVDECDDIRMKIVLRERARALRLPVLMETSDRGMFDVERFDLEAERPLFHGLIGDIQADMIPIELSNEQKLKFVIPIVGADSLSTRAAASLVEVGKTVATWPQLGSEVMLGGATVSTAVRRIALNESMASGRYYVDLLSPPTSDTQQIPEKTNALSPPARQFNNHSLKDIPELIQFLVTQGTLAPSGGNSQPWRFYYDEHTLWVAHDKQRSKNLFDPHHCGAYIALGAAVKNIMIAAAKKGYRTIVETFSNQGEMNQVESVAKLQFVADDDEALLHEAQLFSYLSHRVTSRKVSARRPLLREQADILQSIAASYECHIDFVTEESDLRELSQILGAGDRLRFLCTDLHREMMAEIRWTQAEAQQTRDGIDIESLELTTNQAVILKMLKRPTVIKFLREQQGGARLSELSQKAVETASAIGLITVKGRHTQDLLRGGKAIQHLWLKTTELELAWHPMTALIYMFSMMQTPNIAILTKQEQSLLSSLEERFNTRFKPRAEETRLMLFKLFWATPPTTRSLRIPLQHVLFYGKPDTAQES